MKQLGFNESASLMKKYKIKVPSERLASTEEEAVKSAETIGYPVVCKIISPDIIHKTDVGGVITGLSSSEGVSKAFRALEAVCVKRKARFSGVLVQEELSGTEVIIGGKTDPQFGPVILFGLGGVLVEVMKDASVRVAPVSKPMAMEMIKEIKGYPLLAGARGKKPADIKSLAVMINKVSGLMMEEKVSELDLNPVLAGSKGCTAVDVRVMV